MRICFCALISALSWFILYKLLERHGMQYHGQMALQTAILVAFTQIIPEHQVQILGIIKARVKVCIAVLNLETSSADYHSRVYRWLI
jgi:hypothetical protein